MTTTHHQDAIANIRSLLLNQSLTPDQLAETAVHALYPTLSEGAHNTFRQLGRGAVLMDLRELAEGKLNTSYLSEPMLAKLNLATDLFDLAVDTVASYDPEQSFVAIVWQETLLTVFRLELI